MAQLRKELGSEFGGSSGNPGSSLMQSQQNSLLQNRQQSHEMTWGDIRDPLDRTDTLERNPHCVDPNLVQPKLEHHQEQQQIQQQQQQMVREAANEGQQFTTIMTPVSPVFVQPNSNGQNIWTGENPVTSIIFGPEDLQLLNGTNQNHQYQGPTSANPCTDDYPGNCQFQVSFETMSSTCK